MKYTIGIFYLIFGLFMTYITIDQYLQNHDLYSMLFSYTTENRNIFLAVRGGLSVCIILIGVLKLKKIYASKS